MDDSINTPLKRCTKCKQAKPLDCFSTNKSRPDGLQHRCKQCVKSAYAAKPRHQKPKTKDDIPSGYKRCTVCKEVKEATLKNFYARKNQPDGLNYTCKECLSQQAKAKYVRKRPEYICSPGYKQCHKCKEIKPATNEYYHADKTKPDGLCTICGECKKENTRQYRKAHTIDVRAKEKQWRIAHRDRYTAYLRHYHHENKQDLNAKRRQYYQKHREILIQRQQEYAANNKDRLREFYRIYHQSHRDQARIARHNRRARMKNVPGKLTSEQIQYKLRKQRFRCYYAACGHAKFQKVNGKYVFHLEHTVPVSRTEAGPRHDVNFVVLSCPACNLQKHDKLPHEFWQGGVLL